MRKCVKCGGIIDPLATRVWCDVCKAQYRASLSPKPLTADDVRKEIWGRQETFRTVYEVKDRMRGKV